MSGLATNPVDGMLHTLGLGLDNRLDGYDLRKFNSSL